MTTSATFWTNAARKYAASPISNPTNYEDTLNRTRSHLSADDHLLELGCGTGPTALTLSRSVARVTATDFARGMIEIARERLAKDGAQNVRFDTATISQACMSGPFDAIAAFNLLHLIADLDATLADIHAGLKPGGRFISKSVCMLQMAPVFWPMVKVMQLFGKAPYVRFMSPKALRRRIEKAGFRIVEDHTYGGVVKTLFLVAEKAK